MPINVFGSTSVKTENKIDTSLFVQKHYLRTKNSESNIEDNIHMEKYFRIQNLNDPISIREAASKTYVNNFFIVTSIKKTVHTLSSTKISTFLKEFK